MEVAVYPEGCSESLLSALREAAVSPVFLNDLESRLLERSADAAVLIVELADEPLRRLRLIARVAEESGIPVLVVAQHDQLGLIAEASGVSDTLVAPPDPAEMKLRLHRLTSRGVSGDTIRWKDLELNTATYQAHLGTQPVDLTYMEYELLRFFVENQGRVWTREQLLAKVWGYDYFGGARTVDVHVRRLRAKLGEERSSWITTVRSVGYRWG